MSRVAIALALLVFVSSASAQIIYEPVQYAYDAGGTTYYYGGSDPYVHQVAGELYSTSGTWGRHAGFAFASGDVRVGHSISNEPLRVYTDGLPYRNAHVLGFTIDDARNEAYTNATRYFVKRDLLNAAVRQPDGALHVSAQAVPVRVYKSNGTEVTPAKTNPSTPPPLLIIPKEELQRPQPPAKSDKSVASAR